MIGVYVGEVPLFRYNIATPRTNPSNKSNAAGTIGEALVLNTPGSTNGAVECLDAVLDVVPHALALLAGGRPH